MDGRSGPRVVRMAWWWLEEAEGGGYMPWVAVHGRGGCKTHVEEEPHVVDQGEAMGLRSCGGGRGRSRQCLETVGGRVLRHTMVNR